MTKTRIELRTRAGRQEGEDWIMDRLIEMPLSSVGDLAGFGVYDPKQCLTLLSGMKSRGQVFEIALGATEAKVRRWALTRNEILRRYRDQNQVHWPITLNGLRWLLRRLPALEQFYKAAPNIFRYGADEWSGTLIPPADPGIRAWPDPTYGAPMFSWLRSADIHATVRYGDQIWIALIWTGRWGTGEGWGRIGTWSEKFPGLVPYTTDPYWTGSEIDAEPSAWAIIGIDDWAMERAQIEISTSPPESRLFWKVGESPPKAIHLRPSLDSIRDENPYDNLGIPENLVEWAAKNPTIAPSDVGKFK